MYGRISGELFAVMDGQRKMHLLYVDRLDMIPSVSCTDVMLPLDVPVMCSIFFTCRTCSID